MASLSLSCTLSPKTYCLNTKKITSFSLPRPQPKPLNFAPISSSVASYDPLSLRFAFGNEATKRKKKNGRGFGAVCYSAPLSSDTLLWVSTISSAILMVAKGTAISKAFLVPLFALQAPASIIAWIRGEYGVWTAFLALIVRTFFFIPAELELPFLAVLLVILAPYQAMNLRGTQQGTIVSIVIAGYLAFQHFSRTGSLQKAFEQGALIATLAISCITAVSLLLLI